MKVAIGYKIQKGPWGGGNKFARALSNYLQDKGCKVVYNLSDDDIDIILLTDPRGTSPQITIDAGKIIRYIYLKKDVIVVHKLMNVTKEKERII